MSLGLAVEFRGDIPAAEIPQNRNHTSDVMARVPEMNLRGSDTKSGGLSLAGKLSPPRMFDKYTGC